MKYSIKLLTISLSLATLSACGDKKKDSSSTETSAAKEKQDAKTHESTSQEFISTLNNMSEALSKIEDLDSAKAAIPALKEIGLKLRLVKTDMENLGKPDKALEAKLDDKYGTQMKATMTKIGQTMESLKSSDPAAYKLVEKVMTTIMQ